MSEQKNKNLHKRIDELEELIKDRFEGKDFFEQKWCEAQNKIYAQLQANQIGLENVYKDLIKRLDRLLQVVQINEICTAFFDETKEINDNIKSIIGK